MREEEHETSVSSDGAYYKVNSHVLLGVQPTTTELFLAIQFFSPLSFSQLVFSLSHWRLKRLAQRGKDSASINRFRAIFVSLAKSSRPPVIYALRYCRLPGKTWQIKSPTFSKWCCLSMIHCRYEEGENRNEFSVHIDTGTIGLAASIGPGCMQHLGLMASTVHFLKLVRPGIEKKSFVAMSICL